MTKRVIESQSRIKVEIRFGKTEKGKPTSNDAAECIDMVLPRHATVYQNTKQLGTVHLLNISNTYLDIERRAGQSGTFLQSRNE